MCAGGVQYIQTVCVCVAGGQGIGLAQRESADLIGFYCCNFGCSGVLCIVNDAVFYYKEFGGADYGFGEDGFDVCDLGICAEGGKVVGCEDVAYPHFSIFFGCAAYRHSDFVGAPSEVAASGEGCGPYQHVLEISGRGIVVVVCRRCGLGEVKGCHRACGRRETVFVGVIGRDINLMFAGGYVVYQGGVFDDTGVFVFGAGDGYVIGVVEVSVHHYAIAGGSFVDFIDEVGGHQVIAVAGGCPVFAVGAVKIAFAGSIGGLVLHNYEGHIVSALNFDGEDIFCVGFDGYVAVKVNFQGRVFFVLAAVGHALCHDFAVLVYQTGYLGYIAILGKGDAVHDLTHIILEVFGRKLGTGVCNLCFL